MTPGPDDGEALERVDLADRVERLDVEHDAALDGHRGRRSAHCGRPAGRRASASRARGVITSTTSARSRARTTSKSPGGTAPTDSSTAYVAFTSGSVTTRWLREVGSEATPAPYAAEPICVATSAAPPVESPAAALTRPSPVSLRKNGTLPHGIRALSRTGRVGPSQPGPRAVVCRRDTSGGVRQARWYRGAAGAGPGDVVLVGADEATRATQDLPTMTYPKVSSDPTTTGRARQPPFPGDRGADPHVLGRGRHLRGVGREPRRPARTAQRVRLLRRPALRQRPAALRPPADRLRQGHRPALPDHARPPRRAPLRLGHPRPARRARGDEPARHQDQGGDPRARHRGLQRQVPRAR